MRIKDVHRKGNGSRELMSKNTSGGRSSSGPEHPKRDRLVGVRQQAFGCTVCIQISKFASPLPVRSDA